MAVILNLNDIIEVKHFCSLGNQQGINVLHYRVRAKAGAGLTDAAVAGLMSSVIGPLYKAYLPTVARYEGCRIQVVWPLPVQVAVPDTSGAGVGTIATDPLPSQAAMLAKKATTLAGRRNRGRIYLPFWGESQSDATGKPSAAAIALAATLLTAELVETIYGPGADTVTLTPILWRKGGPDYQDVVQVIIRSAWATQRRRSLINRGDQIGP